MALNQEENMYSVVDCGGDRCLMDAEKRNLVDVDDDTVSDVPVLVNGSHSDSLRFGCENKHLKDDNDGDGVVAAADMLLFALEYLGVEDLLSIERVCKSLRDFVRKEPYLWRKIHVDSRFFHEFTDDDLVRLTDRAQGTLCRLSLWNSALITHGGLFHVLQNNLKLTELSLMGCTKLRPQHLLQDLKTFNSVALPGIKRLRIVTLCINYEQLKEFKLLLGADDDNKPNNYKPRIFGEEGCRLSLDDERAIDVETCPKCQQVDQVFDCPDDNCQIKTHTREACRACICCIRRCECCGCCLHIIPGEEKYIYCCSEQLLFRGFVDLTARRCLWQFGSLRDQIRKADS